jgi:flagellar basal body-associated protein FliL
MVRVFREIVNDPEKRAKTLFWIWILSLVMTVIGYGLIFYFLFWNQK